MKRIIVLVIAVTALAAPPSSLARVWIGDEGGGAGVGTDPTRCPRPPCR
jgi:hypothetical protein